MIQVYGVGSIYISIIVASGSVKNRSAESSIGKATKPEALDVIQQHFKCVAIDFHSRG